MKWIVALFSRLSLNTLYVLSDLFIYPLAYYVVRYRRKLVRLNLNNSFPDKTDKERKQIEKQFYHHFADLLVEILWAYSATEEQMAEHLVIDNIDEIEQWVNEKKMVFVMLGHFGNWEWITDLHNRFQDKQIKQYNVYRRLKNKTFDRLMLSIRERFSGEGSGIEKNDVLRRLFAINRSGERVVLGMVSDQKVLPRHAHLWTTFLNQDTAFLGGSEVLSRKWDNAVCYLYITQVERGKYNVHAILITLNPKQTQQYEITERFARLLEQNIQEQPHLWLWTHNRWKWKRENV